MTLAADRTTVAPDELARRVITPDEFVADTAAFVDVRLPRSQGKASYSFIGPGVSQNADQTINLTEPHGFNVGAASMPHGVVNNLHLHFTAEVFLCTRGRWRMSVGRGDDQRHIEIGPGDVFSAPTWVFRGFENIGDDDGWLFTVLGGDDTGGIIWAPEVLREAADTGLFLSPDDEVLDARAGDPVDDALDPLSDDELGWVRRVDEAELARRLVTRDRLAWSDRALLSAHAGHEVALASVIGHGLSEDRGQTAPMLDPHGFSIDWLRVAPGHSTGCHRVATSQVLLLVDGDWEIALNGGGEVTAAPVSGSVVSVPAGAWRDFHNVGDAESHAIVVTCSDARTPIEWHADVVTAAESAGWVRDANGFIAPRHLVRRRR